MQANTRYRPWRLAGALVVGLVFCGCRAEKSDHASRQPESERAGATEKNEASEPQFATSVDVDEQPAERIVLLSSIGPVFVDLILTIDDQPLQTALRDLVERILHDVRPNGNVPWSELLDNGRFQAAADGQAIPDDPYQRQQLAERYDSNKDEFVSSSELTRFLTRSMPAAGPFQFQSSNFYRSRHRNESPLFLLLDDDMDGRIDENERAMATSRLRGRDYDGNDIIVVNELMRSDNQLPGPLEPRQSLEPEAALWLRENVDWDRVRYTMEEHYGSIYQWDSGDRPLLGRILDVLDADRDGFVSSAEFSGLIDYPPQLRMRVDLQSSAEKDAPIRLVSARNYDPDERGLGDDARFDCADNQIRVKSRHLSFLFFVNDQSPSRDRQAQLEQLLTDLDDDENGLLVESELIENDSLSSRLGELDTDQSGDLDRDELNEYLSRRRSVNDCTVQARAGYQIDSLYTAVDSNHDGRLTSREIDSCADVLASLDIDQDGVVDARELRESFLVGIARTEVGNAAIAFRQIPTSSDKSTSISPPQWFEAMDSNRDQEISRQEFLGTPTQFRGIDTSRDGFLQITEAAKLQETAESR